MSNAGLPSPDPGSYPSVETPSPMGRNWALAAPPNTLASQDMERRQAQQQNFELKMKVFYLEEKLADATRRASESENERVNDVTDNNTNNTNNNYTNNNDDDDDDDDGDDDGLIDEEMRSELVAAKLALEERTYEVEARDALLLKARKAIENLRFDLTSLRKKHQEKSSISDAVTKEVETLRSDLQGRVEDYTTLLGSFKILEGNQLQLQSENEALRGESAEVKQLRMALVQKDAAIDAAEAKIKDLESSNRSIKSDAEKRVSQSASEASSNDKQQRDQILSLTRAMRDKETECGHIQKVADETASELEGKLAREKRRADENEKVRSEGDGGARYTATPPRSLPPQKGKKKKKKKRS